MNQNTRKFFSLGLIIIGLNINVQAKNAPLDKIIVVVNNDVITQSEINNKAEEIKNKLILQGQANLINKDFKKDLLQQLIEEKLQLQLAKKLALKISPKDLDEAINNIAKSNNLTLTALKENMQKDNINFDEFKKNLKTQLLLQRLQQTQLSHSLNFSDNDLQNEIKKIKSIDKQQRSTYQLQHLLLAFPVNPTLQQKNAFKKQTQAINADLKKHPNEFSNYAKTHQKTYPELQNADLGLRSLSDVPELFEKTVPTLKIGEIRSGFQDDNGIHFIKLIKKEYEAPSQEMLKNFASNELSNQQLSKEIKPWLTSLKKNAYIKFMNKQ